MSERLINLLYFELVDVISELNINGVRDIEVEVRIPTKEFDAEVYKMFTISRNGSSWNIIKG